ncbi:MAG: hypothetical protein NVS2B4_07640 [Ramlibacter sp.]
MRVIPIAGQPALASDCHEDSGEVRKVDLPLVRRQFLKGTGLLFGTLAAGTLVASLAPSTAWALELKALGTGDGEALMAMGRVLYPHARLPDAVYALLAKDLDAKAAGDAAFATQIKDGVAWLNKSSGGSFAKAAPDHRLDVVKSMEGTAFFNAVRGQCITSLYDNDMAYAVFGYPGSSWEKGGYITRGFQDLKWLPAPSNAASPPPYMG